MGNAVLQALVFNAGGAHHVFQRGVAVGTQRHQLLHIALKGGVIALAQKLQGPAPLLPVQLEAKQQRRLVAEHPFQRFQRRIAVGPGLAVADRNLSRIGKAGLHGDVGLPVHDSDFVALFQKMPGGANANNSGAE